MNPYRDWSGFGTTVAKIPYEEVRDGLIALNPSNESRTFAEGLDLEAMYAGRNAKSPDGRLVYLVVWRPVSSPEITAIMHRQSRIGGVMGLNGIEQDLDSGDWMSMSVVDKAVQMCYWSPSFGQGYNYRWVQALVSENGQWTFHVEGDEAPWEDDARYRKRLVRDRFDRAMAGDYLHRFGAPVRDDSFWQADGEWSVIYSRR